MIWTIFIMGIEQKVEKAEGGKKSEGSKKPVDSMPKFQVYDGEKGKYVQKVGETKAHYEQPTTSKSEYDRVVGEPTKPLQEGLAAQEKKSLSQRVSSAIRNVKNITNNAVDMVVGVPMAKYYNWQTVRSLKKNPSSNNQILYSMHGVKQGPHNQWRLARQAKKQGYNPYLLKAEHDKGPEHTANQAFDQIYDLHKKAGIQWAEFRKDKYIGHSSGANTGLYMATDKRIKETGIKEVHAVAATPHGVAMDTIGKKVMGLAVNLDLDRYDKEKGQKAAIKLYERGAPNIDVYMMGGKADGLVTPKDLAYTHAKGIHLIDHKDSTHFGTSGSNSELNKIMLQLVSNPKMYAHPQEFYKKEKKAA